MRPAHHLHPGELVAGATLEEPGYSYIPRLSADGAVGVADAGDVGARVGTSLGGVDAGAHARVYLARRFDLTVLGDYAFAGLGDFETNQPIIAAARLGVSPNRRDEIFYGGIQSFASWGDTTEDRVIALGAYAGGELFETDQFAVQLELSYAPLARRYPSPNSTADAPYFHFEPTYFRGGIGVQWFPGRRAEGR